MAKKILILNPPGRKSTFTTTNDFNFWINRERDVTAYNYISFPYFLCQLTQFLRDNCPDWEVELFDSRIKFLTPDKVLAKIRKAEPDILAVILGCYTIDIDQIYLQTGCKTVAFFSPTSTPAAEAIAIYNLKADYFIQGDPEIPLTHLLNNEAGMEKSVDLATTSTDQLILSAKKPLPYADLPLASYDEILDLRPYFDFAAKSNNSYKRKWFSDNSSYVYLWHQEGCPFKCNFCQYSRLPFSAKTPRQIFQEMDFFHRRYGIRNFDFLGAEFTADREDAKELCRLLIDSGMSLEWSSGDRVDYYDEELVALMKQAGCRYLTFGVEVLSGTSRQIYNRQQTESQFEQAMVWTKRHGIPVRFNLIVGLPDEGPHELEEKLEFIKRFSPDQVALNPFFLGPASKLYLTLLEESRIIHKRWHDYQYLHFKEDDYPCASPYWRSNRAVVTATRDLDRRARTFLSLKKLRTGRQINASIRELLGLYIPAPIVSMIRSGAAERS